MFNFLFVQRYNLLVAILDYSLKYYIFRQNNTFVKIDRRCYIFECCVDSCYLDEDWDVTDVGWISVKILQRNYYFIILYNSLYESFLGTGDFPLHS